MGIGEKRTAAFTQFSKGLLGRGLESLAQLRPAVELILSLVLAVSEEGATGVIERVQAGREGHAVSQNGGEGAG